MPSSQPLPPQRRFASLPRQAASQTNVPERHRQQTQLSTSTIKRNLPISPPETELVPLNHSSTKSRATTSYRTLRSNEADPDEAPQLESYRRDKDRHGKEKSRKELEAEVRKLKDQLAQNQRVDNLRRITDGFSPISRPSEARNSPYEVAGPRKALGLELKVEDEDMTKIFKNLTWNWLRETARETILYLQFGQQLKRGVKWEKMTPEDQEMTNTEFVTRVQEGGALGLPFSHSPEAPHVLKFKNSWPAKEMLKTVLRDQRVNTQNITVRELVANRVYNLHRKRYVESFPSDPEPEVRKSKQKRAVGRPKKKAEQLEAEFIDPASMMEFQRIEKEVKLQYAGLETYPEFSFDERGFIRMPETPPKPGSEEESNDETGAISGRVSDKVRSQSAHGDDSTKSRSAKRRKIVDTTRRSPDHQELDVGRLSWTPSDRVRASQDRSRGQRAQSGSSELRVHNDEDQGTSATDSSVSGTRDSVEYTEDEQRQSSTSREGDTTSEDDEEESRGRRRPVKAAHRRGRS